MAYQRRRNALYWPKTAAEVRPRPTDVGDPDSEDEDDNTSLGFDPEHEFGDDLEDDEEGDEEAEEEEAEEE